MRKTRCRRPAVFDLGGCDERLHDLRPQHLTILAPVELHLGLDLIGPGQLPTTLRSVVDLPAVNHP